MPGQATLIACCVLEFGIIWPKFGMGFMGFSYNWPSIDWVWEEEEKQGSKDKELGCGWMWLAVEGNEEGMVGWRRRRVSSVLWCIVGHRLQLLCRCAAWLTQRLAGSQSQCREAVPPQFSVSEWTGKERREGRRRQRCKRDKRREQGEERGEACKKQMGVGMRWGNGNGRRQAASPYLQI